MWGIWKHAIRACMLSDGTLYNKILKVQGPRSSWIFKKQTPKKNIFLMMEELTSEVKQIIGNQTYTDKWEEAVIENLSKCGTIWAWTDGSMMNNSNGHGYIIKTKKSIEGEELRGYGRTLRGSTMSSLRSEHCGVIATLVCILLAEMSHGVCTGARCEIYTDSMTVVERLGKSKSNVDFMSTDFDVWNLSIKIINELKTDIIIHHVKAHQDMIIGPLTIEQHFNVKVDQLAKKGCSLEDTLLNNAIATPVTVKIGDTIVTAKLNKELYNHMAGKPLRDYIQEKFNWPKSTVESIDWANFGRYFRSIPAPRLANVIKYIYNWQYVKVWEDRRNNIHSQENGKITDQMCPMECGCTEDHQHFMKCIKVTSNEVVEKLRYSIKMWMKRTLCSSKMINLIQRILKNYAEGEVRSDEIIHKDDDTALHSFIKEQEIIGWNNFFKGYVSKRLAYIQQAKYDDINKQRKENDLDELGYKYQGDQWVKNFIGQLIYYSLCHWQIRNEWVHEGKQKEEKRKYKFELLKEVIKLYEEKDEMEEKGHYLFSMTPIERCMKSTIEIEGWIETVKAYKKNLRNKDICGIMKYMNRTLNILAESGDTYRVRPEE